MVRVLPYGVPFPSPRCVRSLVVVANILREETFQVAFVNCNDVIQEITAGRRSLTFIFTVYRQSSFFLTGFGFALSLIEVQPIWRQSSVVCLIHWRSDLSCRNTRRIQSPK